MNLVVSSITMVDLTNKEAKRISFSPKKNLLTSTRNHLGKSVIMKSIYYTLGAEVYYPNPIKRLNLLTYIDFSLNAHLYRVARLKNTFVLYCDGVFDGCYQSVGDFEERLCEIFDLEIDLVSKDRDGTIIKCPPAFYYMPYYVDQENGWAVNSSSFDKMAQFDLPQRKNSYFFHLGVLDNSYVEISKRHKTNKKRIDELTKEIDKYRTVIETLQAGLNAIQMSFDTASLERAISSRQQEIKRILEELTQTRFALLKAEDDLIQLTHEKELLSKYIKKKVPNEDFVSGETIECPRCGMVFEQVLTQRLEKIYLRESLLEDYTVAAEGQKRLEKQIIKLKRKFEAKQQGLKDFEKELAADRESYNTYVKSKATNQLLKEYWDQISYNSSEIDRLRKDSAEINQRLSAYTQEREQANTVYQGNLTRLLAGLDIPSDQVETESEPGTHLSASGAYGPRCKIAQMLAFVETQHSTAPDLITFPMVIDSPNVLEQDDEHLESIIRTLLTWDKTSNQIIVASIQGRNMASTIDDVKIITLDNPQNHLFDSAEYAEYEAEIAEIFTQF